MCNRRDFLARSLAATSLATIATPSLIAQDDTGDAPRFPICVFTKPLNSMSFDNMALKLAEAGFDGVEATVRKGGNVLPENAAEKLPDMHRSMQAHNMEITLITTDIASLDDPHCETILKTAADLGIQRFRMRYGKYNRNQPIPLQLDRWKRQFAKLAEFCEKVGIQALYQNHAGEQYMGAAIWDLDRVLGDISPDHIGVVYDIRHAQVEGGMSWPVTWKMIQPRVRMLYVKDYRWDGNRVENVPLGEGLVNPKFFEMVRTSDLRCPVSLHEEYLDHRDPDLVPQHLHAMQRDLKVLQNHLRG
ncbi:sugar phosphate isomerase/epimerase family protein [Rhodopirellula halodulae]|uniref:sugar phosphate isomerase/epimerase family protein n=1 Tax=Rhodopirellula halodulae TaxID=2894198 RepID=UPI001E4075E8|nr:sugar phosphate isomerase/epimerase family protein [Rhodopirellula sp. JC737]MCC9655232.1 sugar phosphate isomerase/epimerase [Rhodopirellula sp. JC737]